jgi:chemotaxis protein methyltransferase CheR
VREFEANDVRLFLEAIHACYGYDLRDYAPASMTRRVRAALAKSGLADLGTLRRQVLADPQVFARVLPSLTVQVSELFRDPDFFRAFREGVMPLLRTYPVLNIWHAGCAGGEEAYSTAVLLREAGIYDRCQLYATDLSPAALERAKRGIYAVGDLDAVRDRHRRAGGAQPLEAHATIAYGQIAFNQAVRARILFFQHDLVADHVFAEMHVVFCRNVLIYFGRQLKAPVMRKLEGSMSRGGCLCLGASERLAPADRSAFVELAPRERIYRHRGEA